MEMERMLGGGKRRNQVICTTVSRWMFLLMLLITCSSASDAVEDDNTYMVTCRSPLGMFSGDIPDSAITASSSHDIKNVGPQNARIRTEKLGGAWCPSQLITHNVTEWLQVEFPSLHVISVLETQGRFGNGQGQEYAPYYLIEYQRQDGGRWMRYRNRQGQVQVFEGNMNTYTPQLREVRPPIIAKRVRFIPYTYYPRTVCMRVELYGCEWEDKILSYSMPQGEKRGVEVDLRDFLYDGLFDNHTDILYDGLGQLTDWESGYFNFRLDISSSGKKGFEWVGWRDDSNSTSANVEIVVQFSEQRNVSAIRIHCNNIFSKDVKAFRRAEVYFSLGGKRYLSPPIVFVPERDDHVEFGRHITIPLPNSVGQYAKIRLFFAARWLMISELRIDSRPVNQLLPIEPELVTVTTTVSTTTTTEMQLSEEQESRESSLAAPESEFEPDYVHVIALGGNETHVASNHDFDLVAAEYSGSTYLTIVIGSLCIFIILLVSLAIVFAVCYKRRKYVEQYFPAKQSSFGPFTSFSATFANGKILGSSNYNPVSLLENDSAESTPPFVRVIYGNHMYEAAVDATPGSTPLHVVSVDHDKAKRASQCDTAGLMVAPSSDDRVVMAAAGRRGIEGTVGSSLWLMSGLDLLWKEDTGSMEYPRHALNFIEKLGVGRFGEVHLCETTQTISGTSPSSTVTPAGTLVAVKVLTMDDSSQACQEFSREAKLLSHLRDANICQLVGVCMKDRPPAIIMEYSKHGDLCQLLQRCSLEGRAIESGCLPISHGCLVYMATQIASGMKYLETMNIAHRDLAARNCLVGDLYEVKVSDVAVCRPAYRHHYYAAECSSLLPVRWMAWESCLLGKYSTKSDVWAFAVTLWELLTLARSLPLAVLTDEEVLDNCAHFYMADGCDITPSQPAACPREIYDLMRECWRRDETQRPTFREIHMFLQRKSSGFDPSRE